ncbi:histone acetyltransferase KAT2A-like [Prinia subflava]|uniref:histone acetyltransferase KAT2A-like n=1 Tax=Prinia subflava TaxID=208062 RepID=UPI002FDFB531
MWSTTTARLQPSSALRHRGRRPRLPLPCPLPAPALPAPCPCPARSLPLPCPLPAPALLSAPGPDTQQPRDGGSGAGGSGRPPRPVLGLPPIGWGRGRDRGDWGDARLRAELKAVLVSVRGDKTAPPASALYTGVRSGGGSERRD